ncbi:AsmA family protein [Ferrimonas gelatinilytica]|uniref:AsmA family protein n=1 Tax=Ferrimonas gelatinilytica TaxID=1255257 RepID=A0ABP9RZJ1_9GAMM
MSVFKGIGLFLAAVIIAAVGYFALVFDLNGFKQPIEQKVSALFGRELKIGGEIGWSLYPSIGLQLSQVELANLPQETLPPLLQVDKVAVGVALMPLLSRRLEVEQVMIDKAQLHIVTLADGRTSFTGLGQQGQGEAPTASTEPAKGKPEWRLGELALTDLTIINDNRQQGAKSTLHLDSFTLTDFEPGRASPLNLKLAVDDGQQRVETRADAMLTLAPTLDRVQLDGWQQAITIQGPALPVSPMEVDLSLDADLDTAAANFALRQFQLSWQEFDFAGTGSLSLSGPVPLVKLKGQGNRLDLSPFMSENGTGGAAQGKGETKGEPDLSAMSQVDVELDVGLASLNVPPVDVTDARLALTLKRGVLKVTNMTGRAFDGSFSATAALDSGNNSYQFKNQIQGLALLSLLQAVADTGLLSGTGALTLSGHGKGLNPDTLLRNLTVDGALEVADGALNGINVAQMIRSGQARLSGAPVEEKQTLKTDFAALSMALSMKEGVFATREIALASPLLRIHGDGSVDVARQAMNYDMVVSLVGSLEGQGGGGIDELKDVPIPLKIGGSLTKPEYSLDLESLAEEKLKQEGKKLEDKLKDKLFKKLGEM